MRIKEVCLGVVFLFFTVTYVQAKKISFGEHEISLDKLTSIYDRFGCPGVIAFEPVQERMYDLLTLEDLLTGISSSRSKTLVGDMAGNIRVTSLTREVNDNYIRLSDYAKRSDIGRLAKEDLKSVREDFDEYDHQVLHDEISVRLGESKYIKGLYSKTLSPLAVITNQDFEIEVLDMLTYVYLCRAYEMVFVEGSKGDRMVGEYLRSISNTARIINFNKLNDALGD